MVQSEQIESLYKALVKAQAEFKPIHFDAINPHFKNKYATLGATQESVRPILAKHGLAVIQSLETDSHGEYFVETLLIHESGQSLKSKTGLIIDRKNMQGLGSATTYAKRYAMQAMLGISGDDDDDGNIASKSKPAPQKPNETYKKVEPKDFVLNMGSDEIKGKPLGELTKEQLISITDYTRAKLKETPPPPNKGFLGLLHGNVKKLLKEKFNHE
jgi:hypothetical protein